MQAIVPSPRHLSGRFVFIADACILFRVQVLSLNSESFAYHLRQRKWKNAQKILVKENPAFLK